MELPDSDKKDIPIKIYAPCELARIYGVDKKTLKKWLAPFVKLIGVRNGRFFSIKQVRLIFKCLGSPNPKKKKDFF